MPVRTLVFIACAVACAVAHVAILSSVVRRPAIASDPAVPRPRRGLEVLWALIPLAALALVLTATWNRVRASEANPHGAHEIMKVAR